jgi:hypothetical protein
VAPRLNSALLAVIAVALVVIAVDALRRPHLTAEDIANAVALAQGKPCITPVVPPAALEP